MIGLSRGRVAGTGHHSTVAHLTPPGKLQVGDRCEKHPGAVGRNFDRKKGARDSSYRDPDL